MCHLAEEAVNFGCLDNCSGFPYENYLQQVKKLVTSARNPLVQIAKRLSELKLKTSGSLLKSTSVTVSKKMKNNAFILDTQFVVN